MNIVEQIARNILERDKLDELVKFVSEHVIAGEDELIITSKISVSDNHNSNRTVSPYIRMDSNDIYFNNGKFEISLSVIVQALYSLEKNVPYVD